MNTLAQKKQRFLENYREARFAIGEVVGGFFSNSVVATTRGLASIAAALPERVERGGLAVQQFAGVYPLDLHPTEDLTTALDAVKAQLAGFAAARGLHAARVMHLRDRDPELPGVDANTHGALLLGLVFDGSRRDVLNTLLAEVPALSALLALCRGFPGSFQFCSSAEPRASADAPVLAFIEAGRLRGGYFFSDIEDVCQTEIKRAGEIREAFVEFQAKLSRAPTQQEFKAFWDSLGERRAPFSWLEQRLEDEERWARRALEGNQCSQERETRRVKRENPHGVTPRGVHVKHHGCLEAEFELNPELEQRFRVGVFKQDRYRALVRLSNSRKTIASDHAYDGRGLAIKLINVRDEERVVPPFPQGIPELDETVNQDFILFSHPVFFTKDVVDFTILQSIFDTPDVALQRTRLAIYFARRPRAATILWRTLRCRTEHPLDIKYHSATPYLLGKDLAVKYSIEPVLEGKSFARNPPDHDDPDYLRKTLQESLSPERPTQISLRFMIHVLRNGQQPPVEDACADWSALGAEPIHAATLTIQSQDFSSPALRERAEQITFNPWNGIAAHKPLGSLNRARLLIYQASAERRHARPDVSSAVQRRRPSSDDRPSVPEPGE